MLRLFGFGHGRAFTRNLNTTTLADEAFLRRGGHEHARARKKRATAKGSAAA